MFPLVLPQALYVRRTAPRFSAADGPNSGSVTGSDASNNSIRLIAVGDSIIAGVGARDLARALVGQTAHYLSEHMDSRVDWWANGQVGATAADMLLQVDELPEIPADVILLSVGVNDVTGLTRLSTWRERLQVLINNLRSKYPNALLVMAGLPPLQSFPLLPAPLRNLLGMRASELDSIAIDIVSDIQRAVHLPVRFPESEGRFADDGYHPSEAGYREFGEQLSRHMSAHLAT